MKGKIISLLIIICITFTGCVREKNKYLFDTYTKDEVISLFNENKEKFDEIVKIVSDNNDFYEKDRQMEYEDADITSPYDEALKWFSASDKDVIVDFFELKPYMISYDYNCRFVKFTFIGSDDKIAYCFLFWFVDGDEDAYEFEDHKDYLRQNYVVKNVAYNWILYY